MDATVSDVDEIMHKTGGEQRGRIYLGTEYEGVDVVVAVSRRAVGEQAWDGVEQLLAAADLEDVPEPVVDEMIDTLADGATNQITAEEGEWSAVATLLTGTDVEEIPDQVVSAMRAKLTQADMEGR